MSILTVKQKFSGFGVLLQQVQAIAVFKTTYSTYILDAGFTQSAKHINAFLKKL